MTGAPGRSAFVAAVFAVHPLHVESVAWATERKDVLAGLFFSLHAARLRALRRAPGLEARYALVLLALACGLLSKPTVVTLPFVLLLLDFWPLGRLRAVAGRERAPRLAREAADARAGRWPRARSRSSVQRSGGGMEFAERELPLGLRLWNALDSYGVYLVQAVWPSDLSVFYPHPGEAVSRGRAALSGVAAGGGQRSGARARAPRSLSAGRLALVPGHAGPRDRDRAGGHAGARGPLHVPAAPGARDRGGLGRRRSGRAARRRGAARSRPSRRW